MSLHIQIVFYSMYGHIYQLAVARFQGEHVAAIAKKLTGQ